MNSENERVITNMKGVYGSLTNIEKIIADFFLKGPDIKDLSAQSVAAHLFVSSASLTRFAQKCGYTGYRQFIFDYQQNRVWKDKPAFSESGGYIFQMLSIYQNLLDETRHLFDEEKIKHLCARFASSSRVFVYGIGSSGLVANEIQMRLMRLGLNIYSITDGHLMEMNSVIVDGNCLVMGLSLSGKTAEVLKSLKAAKAAGASTVLITALKSAKLDSFCDEVIRVAATENLSGGKIISPQFPLLLFSDVVYAYYLSVETVHKELLHKYTLDILEFQKK
ncbi:MAG: MurR/RpiR family transcriptional regulator [Lachnospiraceae bacterium]|nr:MurR/RpiR family transcriptional regulator [Lachnospiraceae bacterium]